MSNFAANDTNLTDTLDYLLSGYNSLGNEFEGKSSGTPAYMLGYGETTQTQPNNPPYSNIGPTFYYATDMFIPITITDARQRVVVGMSLTAQMGVYSESFPPTIPPTPGGYPATGDFWISLNRIPAKNLQRSLVELSWLEPYTIQQVIIPFSAPAADVVDGYPLTVGTAGCVFTNIVDQPGEPGDYFYWQSVYYIWTSAPNYLQVQWFELRNRSIGASMVKP